MTVTNRSEERYNYLKTIEKVQSLIPLLMWIYTSITYMKQLPKKQS